MSTSGVGAMVKCAVWAEDVLGVEVLSIGREGLAPAHSCELQMCGRQFLFTITLDSGSVYLRVQPVDGIAESDLLLTVADDAAGWQTVCKLVRALERSGLTKLERPIEVGGEGPDGFVIA